jgi:hypothetical protein
MLVAEFVGFIQTNFFHISSSPRFRRVWFGLITEELLFWHTLLYYMSHNIIQAAAPLPFANPNIDALRREIRAGNLPGVQNTFSEWLEDDPSNISKIGRFYLCIGDAIECSQHEILTYLLSEGFPLDMFDISLATRRKERRALEILIAHGWNINKPRTNRDPPLLRYAASYS